MLEEIKRETVFIWSGENIFTVEAVLSRQNDRIYARDDKRFLKSSRIHLRSDKTVGVMV